MTAVTLQGADLGDTTTVHETVAAARESLATVAADREARKHMKPLTEMVCDKGYHSGECLMELHEQRHLRTYVSEPNRGRRKWKGKRDQQGAVYANRQRIRGTRGQALMRQRGELVERSFAHVYDTGGMRRTHLCGHKNILKRLLIHTAGFNLSLIFRKTMGIGKPRRLQDLPTATQSAPGSARKTYRHILACTYSITVTVVLAWRSLSEKTPDNRQPVAV